MRVFYCPKFKETNMNTTELIAEIRKTYEAGALAKATVSTTTGLVNYDLQAPAKNLYPVNTPLRNSLPRVKGNGDVATRWKVVSAINGSGYQAMPWVAEGQRTAVMTLTEADKLATYKTLGEEASLTFEAWSAAEGFEDEKARNAIRLLQQNMLKEENAILGGNNSVALGTPTTPTMTTASTGGTVAAGTYTASVVALTYEGYRNWLLSGASIVTGLPTSQTITGADALTYVLHGGSSQKSATVTGSAISGTGTIALSTPVVNGAVAYGWYINDGAAGVNTLQTVTTINSYRTTVTPTTSGQSAAAITADNSQNTLAYDGLLYNAFTSGSGAYIVNLATGTAGTGTVLTSSGVGTVTEIDVMLYTMWNNYQTSPTVIYVNAQQMRDITTKCLSNSSAPLLQYVTDPTKGYAGLQAGGSIEFYFNQFAMNGGVKIPIKIHPMLPPGTIIGWCEQLPIQYQSSNVPNVAEVHCRRDYYQIDWPLRTRLYETGVYSETVLANYVPFAMGIINNVAPG